MRIVGGQKKELENTIFADSVDASDVKTKEVLVSRQKRRILAALLLRLTKEIFFFGCHDGKKPIVFLLDI